MTDNQWVATQIQGRKNKVLRNKSRGCYCFVIFNEHDECKTKNSSEIAAKIYDSDNEVTRSEKLRVERTRVCLQRLLKYKHSQDNP